MDSNLIVVCDYDLKYASRLSDYFKSQDGFTYEIQTYTQYELFIESFRDKEIKILIADEGFVDRLHETSSIQSLKVSKVISLINRKDNAIQSSQNQIYKYQSARVIYESIFSEGIAVNRAAEAENIYSDDNLRDHTKKIKGIVQEKLLIRGTLSDNETLKIIDESIGEYDGKRIGISQRNAMRNQIFYSIKGLDVLEELISDESITEIMVNGENSIFYEKEGRLICAHKSFDSRERLLDIIQKIVARTNRLVNISSPIVDSRLEDGSRANVVLEPISLDGPILTIRRFPKEPLTAEKLIENGAVSEEIMLFLSKLVYAGYNILVSGGTGSGKTTFLNILSSYIPSDERIITIEDSAELRIMGIENLVRLESRNASVDGQREITIRDLIKSALRMRPDRVIVGECRGAEAIDMVQAFTVGEDGSMSTIHANSAEDALYRLEMLMMLGGMDVPIKALRRQIATGVDIVIQLGRLKDKSRRLLEIIEVTGYENETIMTNCLYKYECGDFVKMSELKNKYKYDRAFIV